MNRRVFLGGVVTGAATALGGRAVWPRDQAAPVPVSEPATPAIPEHARLSFSQQGEDLLLYHAARDLLKLDRPSYMDVGAAFPVKGNNTYLLYTQGSRVCSSSPTPRWRISCAPRAPTTSSCRPASV